MLRNMDCVLLRFLFLVFYIKHGAITVAVHKFAHQRDMSEHCKRRVIPSVFLGTQVMQAGSHVMHFSQLEVPYSCFLSVRAESGYNIILVIEVLSEQNLLQTCAKNKDQLIIYELGETFGGYWGPQPDAMIKPTARNYTKYYTLKTTQTPSTRRHKYRYENTTEKILKYTFPPATDREPDYIRMEVPLVNVSGNLQLGQPLRHSYNAEEMFDFIYDVTPRNGSEYDTSIMPLVQFSIRPQTEGYDGKQRYELDYDVQGFTLDPRLIFSTLNHKIESKQRNWLANRRINFGKKNTQLFTRKNKALYFQKLFTYWSTLTNATIKSKVIPTLDPKYSTVSWKYIEDILKYLNSTSDRSLEEKTTNTNVLKDISDRDPNISVYLNPNIKVKDHKDDIHKINNVRLSFNTKSTETYQPILLSSKLIEEFEISTSISTEGITEQTMSLKINDTSSVKYWKTENLTVQSTFYDNETTVDDIRNRTYIDSENGTTEIIKQDTKEINTSVKTQSPKLSTNKLKILTTIKSQLQTGTMVDHKSLENVVQAAPVMAVVLNSSDTLSIKKTKKSQDEKAKQASRKVQKSIRKKRHIQSLRIDDSRPRNLTNKPTVSTETEPPFRITDIQDLAKLVELQDDEMEGRVALRYLRNYVGSALFNLCDFSEPKSRQTLLFNASRIVIAISNFTLNRVHLVATPAQSLTRGAFRCPPTHLECQVVGTRVCIDNTNACDGVPNCGSYDIFDEDRLMCGITKITQHSVCLAAFTFLAVLLTMIFTIYYWLKRCVPGVSEAFFVYADTSENTLYLDTIMRSPTDMDDTSSKLIFPLRDYDDDILYEDKRPDAAENLCLRLLRNCCRIFVCKRKRNGSQSGIATEFDSNLNKPARLFSFTELELRNYGTPTLKDEGIQTGISYKLARADINQLESDRRGSLSKFKTTKNLEDNYPSELSLIKFAKQTRSSITQFDATSVEERDLNMDRRDAITADDEKEIKTTVYERQSNSLSSTEIPVICEVHPEEPKKRDPRRLRFDDAPILIPSDEVENVPGPSFDRRSVVLGPGHVSKQDLETITEIEEKVSSRDFMRFFGKKGKKKDKSSKHS